MIKNDIDLQQEIKAVCKTLNDLGFYDLAARLKAARSKKDVGQVVNYAIKSLTGDLTSTPARITQAILGSKHGLHFDLHPTETPTAKPFNWSRFHRRTGK